MKEVPVKVTGSVYTAEEFTEGVSQESQNLVLNGGQTLDETNLNQMTQSVCRFGSSKFQYLDNGSTVNNYVVRSYTQIFNSNSFITEYFNGMTVIFQVPITNTGASTINVDGLGVVPILREDGAPTEADILVQNFYIRLVYINGDFYHQKSNSEDINLRNILTGTGGATYVNSATGVSVEGRLDALQNEINNINAFPPIKGLGLYDGTNLVVNIGVIGFSRNDTGGSQRWFVQFNTPANLLMLTSLTGGAGGVGSMVAEVINSTERWIFPGLASSAANGAFQFIWI